MILIKLFRCKYQSFVWFLFVWILFVSGTCISISDFDAGRVDCQGLEVYKIPFNTVGELIVIEAKINGIAGRFLFDNGFSLSAVNKDFAHRAKIEFKDSGKVSDANAKSTELKRTKIERIEVGPISFLGTGGYLVDTKKFFPCDSIDGIIGASAINKANWKIDFQESLISVSCRAFDEPTGAVVLPIEIRKNNSVFTNLEIFDTSVECKIDMGSESNIKVRLDEIKHQLGGVSVHCKEGVKSLSVTGIGNLLKSYHLEQHVPIRSDVKTLSIKAILEVYDQLKYEGYIGMRYLANFDVILNMVDKNLVLVGRHKMDATLENCSYGLILYPVEGQWKIIQMDCEQGIESNGISLMTDVLSVNGMELTQFTDVCSFRQVWREWRKSREPLIVQIEGKKEAVAIACKATPFVRFED